MLYLLIILLVLLCLTSYIVTKRDILSPWFISCLMFLISSIVVIPNINNWNVDLSSKTVFIIFIGLLSFGIGEFYVRCLKNKGLIVTKIDKIHINKNNNSSIDRINIPIEINKIVIIMSIIIMIIVTFLYYKQVLNIAYAAGFSDSSELPMLRFARIATINPDIMQNIKTNKLVGQCVIISYSYAYLMLYITIYNIVFFKFKREYILYIIPILIYFIQIILTGGRTQFIYLIGSSVLMCIIFYKIKQGWNSKINKKYYKNIALAFIFMLVIFYILGSFTGKTEKLNFIETISVYMGSSIVAFDEFIKGYINGTSEFFGINTLLGIYDIFDKLGFKIPSLVKQAEFISIGDYETNIYTSYMRYIKDFSYIGFVFIQMMLGVIFSYIYMIIKTLKKPNIIIVVYAILFQVILECSIEERFFMNILSIGYITRIAYLVILSIILIKYNTHYKMKERE